MVGDNCELCFSFLDILEFSSKRDFWFGRWNEDNSLGFKKRINYVVIALFRLLFRHNYEVLAVLKPREFSLIVVTSVGVMIGTSGGEVGVDSLFTFVG